MEKTGCPSWLEDKMGKLALIILCDQLSRFCFRGKRRSFKYDKIALDTSKKIISQSQLRDYKIVEQIFIIMPLMHSEQEQDCLLSIQLYQSLIEQCTSLGFKEVSQQIQTLKASAEEFHKILTSFGRFPMRNSILGRSSTIRKT